ncbi:MAG: SDR family NAD(P)-dependent oxidoreductase [Candidatus Binatia bacterium]
MRSFGADSTTAEVLDGIDLRGKVVLVTGASGGLGAETARALAATGAAVVLTARDVPKGEAVAQAIRASTGNGRVEVEELELGSLSSVRACARRVLARHTTLHILVNNAGVMACPFGKTAEGYELQFGTNHLGHFLLTCLLVPALRRGAPSRIVCLTSGGHRASPVVFEDIHFAQRPYDKWLSYGQAKTANVLFVVELERRLGAAGIHAYAVHPGMIATELSRHMTQEDFELLQTQMAGMQWHSKTVESGAATTVYAATAPELEGRGGVYIEDCRVAAVKDGPRDSGGVRSYALDPALARRLWTVSEDLVGERFELA